MSNTGNRNTGNWNIGDRNTGNWNTGDWNTGNRNTGNRNTGDSNTGHRNTGDRNTGDWNTGHWNTGYFNTVTPTEILVFNKPTKREEWEECDKPNFIIFKLTEWVDEENMTGEEKEKNSSYKTTGGYLKKLGYKDAFKKSYNEASEEDRKKVFNIPNFDADLFLEISGIDVRIDVEKESKKQALIRKAEELLKQAEEL